MSEYTPTILMMLSMLMLFNFFASALVAGSKEMGWSFLLFNIFGWLIFTFYMPFFGGECLKGIVWHDCPRCPHISIYETARDYTSIVWVVYLYVFISLFLMSTALMARFSED